MNKKVAAKIRKDQFQSKILVILGAAAFISGWVIPDGKSMLWGAALGLTIAGIGTLMIYKRAEKSPAMQENIILELDERNLSLNMQAAAKAFWLSFYWIAIAGLCATFQWLSAYTLLIASLFVMPGIYISVAVYYHKVK